MDRIGNAWQEFDNGCRAALMVWPGFLEVHVADADHVLNPSTGATSQEIEAAGRAKDVLARIKDLRDQQFGKTSEDRVATFALGVFGLVNYIVPEEVLPRIVPVVLTSTVFALLMEVVIPDSRIQAVVRICFDETGALVKVVARPLSQRVVQPLWQVALSMARPQIEVLSEADVLQPLQRGVTAATRSIAQVTTSPWLDLTKEHSGRNAAITILTNGILMGMFFYFRDYNGFTKEDISYMRNLLMMVFTVLTVDVVCAEGLKAWEVTKAAFPHMGLVGGVTSTSLRYSIRDLWQVPRGLPQLPAEQPT